MKRKEDKRGLLKKRRMTVQRKFILTLVLIFLIIYGIFNIPLPYYIYMPGSAERIKPMMEVKKGYPEEKGAFYLTTVLMSNTNVVNYVLALLDPNKELQTKKSVLRGQSQAEYSKRQVTVMQASQSNAMVAAYKKAGVPFHIESQAVLIHQLTPGFPAEKKLKIGDSIMRIDDKPVKSAAQLKDALKDKKAGDSVKVTYKREAGQEPQTIDVQLAELPADPKTGEKKAGLGVALVDLQAVKADEQDKQINMHVSDIGGPSAGLMFSLEMYNQLVPEDITKGYRIAGTGEIDPEGRVGVIGGIQHKIVAADEVGAEIFFAPKDYTANDGSKVPNYTTAVQKAKEIGSKMKIVEVATMDDALQYLASLPPKEEPK